MQVKFRLLHGYLDRSTLKDESEDILCRKIALLLSNMQDEKVECYFGTLQNNRLGDVFKDQIILIKINDGFRPVVIKKYMSSLNYCFKFYDIDYEKLDEESIYEKEFFCSQNNIKIFDVDSLLHLVNESYRYRFHEFLKEKYGNEINQLLLF